jgi:hypothetical protein
MPKTKKPPGEPGGAFANDLLGSRVAREASLPKETRQAVYLLRLKPLTGAGDRHQIRRLLKALLRRYKLQCLSIEEVRQ